MIKAELDIQTIKLSGTTVDWLIWAAQILVDENNRKEKKYQANFGDLKEAIGEAYSALREVA